MIENILSDISRSWFWALAVNVDKRGSGNGFLPCSRDAWDFSSKSGRCHQKAKIILIPWWLTTVDN